MGIHTTDTYIQNTHFPSSKGLPKYSPTWRQIYSPRNIWWCLEIVEFVVVEFFFILKTGSYSVAQAGLELMVILMLNLPNSGITNMNSYAWLTLFYWNKFILRQFLVYKKTVKVIQRILMMHTSPLILFTQNICDNWNNNNILLFLKSMFYSDLSFYLQFSFLSQDPIYDMSFLIYYSWYYI